jgi:predicted ATPase
MSKLRSLHATRYSAVFIEVCLVENGEEWSYQIEFNQDKLRRPVVIKEIVKRGEVIVLERPTQEDREDQALLQQTHLEQLSMNKRFRAISESFKAIRYLHIVPQIIREQTRIIKQIEDPFGSDFLEHIYRVPKATREAWLSKIEEALKAAAPYFDDIHPDKDDKGIPHLYVNFQHWRYRGAKQNEADLSDGTIRLIGLLWALLEGKGLLLLEEPELSLHTEVVRHLAEMMARMQKRTGRQVFVSTHSVELLSNEGISAEEILLLRPEKNGTEIISGSKDKEIKALMDAGFSAAEAAVSHSRPAGASNLNRLVFGK